MSWKKLQSDRKTISTAHSFTKWLFHFLHFIRKLKVKLWASWVWGCVCRTAHGLNRNKRLWLWVRCDTRKARRRERNNRHTQAIMSWVKLELTSEQRFALDAISTLKERRRRKLSTFVFTSKSNGILYDTAAARLWRGETIYIRLELVTKSHFKLINHWF